MWQFEKVWNVRKIIGKWLQITNSLWWDKMSYMSPVKPLRQPQRKVFPTALQSPPFWQGEGTQDDTSTSHRDPVNCGRQLQEKSEDKRSKNQDLEVKANLNNSNECYTVC